MSRTGFIGTGHIAAPMVRFLASRGHDVIVSDRNAETAAGLKASHNVAVAENQTVLDRSDIVFLCLRPHVANDVLASLQFREDQQLVSVMAGITLTELAALCAPARNITLTIPLGYLEQGGCPLPACPSAATLRTLFEPENPVLEVPHEAAFNMHFSVCAFVPGVLDLRNTAAQWLGEQIGAPDPATVYTRQLVAGFLATLPQGGDGVLATARDALATEGTLSLQMTETLRKGGAHEVLRTALDAIGARLGGTP